MNSKIYLLIFALFFSLYALEEESGKFWPDEINNDNMDLVIYQPQLEHYDKITLAARSAISVSLNDRTFFGALWFKGKAAIDKDEQLVRIRDIEIKDIRFLDDSANNLSEKTVLALKNWMPVLTLQSIISDLDLLINEKQFSEKLNNDPPEIIYSPIPAILVVIDGEPVIKSVDDSKYEYVLNTPHFIITKDRLTYYLKISEYWYKSDNVMGVEKYNIGS